MLAESTRIVKWFGWCEEAEHDADDRGFDSGLVERVPADDAERDVRNQRSKFEPLRQPGARDAHGCGGEPRCAHPLGVEDRDHDDAADVVDDGEGEDEDPHAERDATSGERDHADCEGDVGRHGHTEPAGLPSEIDDDVDRRRHDHATECGEGRQCRSAPIAEFAVDELTFDLESDDEEEQRHEPIVDPRVEREVEVDQVADAQRNLGVEELAISTRPGRVGPDQCDDRTDEHDDAASSLDRGEPLGRLDDRERDASV